MAVPPLKPLPDSNEPIVGKTPPSQRYLEYLQQIDKILRTMSINAVNDAAAAAAGVPVGSLYRNGSVVQIRVT
jgi:hypothetical protein